jgi:outer membrane protein assembly factor BamE
MFSIPLSVARRVGLGVCVAGGLALSGCGTLENATASMSTLGGLITPYRIDILQGNVVVREQVQALQPGMPREVVRDILGTPLVASAFHADRWDYVFALRRQGQALQQRRVSVFFANDRLERVEADELPTEEELVASLDNRRLPARPPVALEATPEQLKAFEASQPSAARAPLPPTPAPAIPSDRFPPLEGR